MPFDSVQLFDEVRALMPNITTGQLTDGKLGVYALLAMRRLFKDHPRERTYVLTGNGGKYYALPSDWVVGESSIRKLFLPTTNQVSQNLNVTLLYNKEWSIFPDADGSEKLFIAGELASAETANLTYSVPWYIKDIDGQAVTTLPSTLIAAVEYLTAAMACYALATQAAGLTDPSMNGDLINYRNRQMEYQRAGQQWESQYAKELGINQPVGASAVVLGDYDPKLQTGFTYATHFNR